MISSSTRRAPCNVPLSRNTARRAESIRKTSSTHVPGPDDSRNRIDVPRPGSERVRGRLPPARAGEACPPSVGLSRRKVVRGGALTPDAGQRKQSRPMGRRRDRTCSRRDSRRRRSPGGVQGRERGFLSARRVTRTQPRTGHQRRPSLSREE